MNKSLENRGSEIMHIVGKPPHWLIRWGMTIVFFALFGMLFLASLIRSPDTIRLRIRVGQTNSLIGNEEFISPKEAKFWAEGLVDKDASTKIRAGQDVVIRLVENPYGHYGKLGGRVNSITEIPDKNLYLIKIDMPFDPKTKDKKNINHSMGLTGNAEIIVQNKRLFEMLFRRAK